MRKYAKNIVLIKIENFKDVIEKAINNGSEEDKRKAQSLLIDFFLNECERELSAFKEELIEEEKVKYAFLDYGIFGAQTLYYQDISVCWYDPKGNFMSCEVVKDSLLNLVDYLIGKYGPKEKRGF